jgi:hypothetical protein
MSGNSFRRSRTESGNPAPGRGLIPEVIGILGLLAIGFAIVAMRLTITMDLAG